MVYKRAKLSSGSDLRRSNLSESKSDTNFAETVLMNPLDCKQEIAICSSHLLVQPYSVEKSENVCPE